MSTPMDGQDGRMGNGPKNNDFQLDTRAFGSGHLTHRTRDTFLFPIFHFFYSPSSCGTYMKGHKRISMCIVLLLYVRRLLHGIQN